MTMAKMGAKIEVFDFDDVAVENVGTQMYNHEDIGRPKAFAIAGKANLNSSIGQVTPHNRKITADTDPELLDCDFLVMALDSIEARRDVWSAAKQAAWGSLIDMRMAAELCTLYTISTKEDMARYDLFLASQNPEDIPELACTEKATVYTANFAAGWLAVIIRRLMMDKKVPFIVSHDIMNVDINVV